MSDWQSDLKGFFAHQESEQGKRKEKLDKTKYDLEAFQASVVIPAFKELKEELEKYGRKVSIHGSKESSSMVVEFQGEVEFRYAVKAHVHPGRAYPYPETVFSESGKRYRAQGAFRSGAQDYTIDDITKDEVIENFLSDYKEQVRRA